MGSIFFKADFSDISLEVTKKARKEDIKFLNEKKIITPGADHYRDKDIRIDVIVTSHGDRTIIIPTTEEILRFGLRIDNKGDFGEIPRTYVGQDYLMFKINNSDPKISRNELLYEIRYRPRG